MDYSDLKRAAQPIIDALDHSHLNEIISNPTSENLCRMVAGKIAAVLGGSARIDHVEVGETCQTACRYEP